jgi:uncharacterized protein YbjT (DUF2867 family)
MAKRTVLIAGASGLVGSAAVRHFAQLPNCSPFPPSLGNHPGA